VSESSSLDYAELLAGVELFAGMGRVAPAQLAAHVEPIAVEAGEPVVNQGDPADALYIVASGTLGVYTAAAASFRSSRAARSMRKRWLWPTSAASGRCWMDTTPRRSLVKGDF